MESLYIMLNILCVSLNLLIGFLLLAMLVRSIFSLFNPEEEGMLAAILYAVTEPAIMPVRALLARFHVGEGMPVDISFLVTVILLSTLSMLLPVIVL